MRKAVERGVVFLASRQAPDGSFAEHGSPTHGVAPITVTLHAALALRHAGTPTAAAACERADAWLFDSGEARLVLIERSVDDTGLALMLLLGAPGRRELARRLTSALVASIDRQSGWWRHAATPTTSDPQAPDEPNLDASHHAVLGLIAAKAHGVDVPEAIWARHARSLVEAQTAKYDAWPRKWSECGGIGDTVGTLLGLANLLAAAQALPEAHDGLAADVAASIARARNALGRDAGRTLSDPLGHFEVLGDDEGIKLPGGRKPPFEVVGKQVGRRDPLAPGVGAFARLFALECACRFGDVEILETFPEGKSVTGRRKPKPTKLPCYATAAKWLVSVQQRDGGFAPEADDPAAAPSETDTALALLVLTRAASAFHPAQPAPIDARPR